MKLDLLDLYDLLSQDQKEEIADIFMEAMTSHGIFPEIWEMSLQAHVFSYKEEQCLTQ